MPDTGTAMLPADPPQAVTLHPVDPTDPRAVWCLAQYYAELAARFRGGFDPGPETPESLATLRPPNGLFLLALQSSQPLGCVALRAEDATIAEVKRLWISPNARGQRLATRLMQAIEDHARALGLTHLHLDTNATLTEAITFYRAQGWTDTPCYNTNPYADVWLQKAL